MHWKWRILFVLSLVHFDLLIIFQKVCQIKRVELHALNLLRIRDGRKSLYLTNEVLSNWCCDIRWVQAQKQLRKVSLIVLNPIRSVSFLEVNLSDWNLRLTVLSLPHAWLLTVRVLPAAFSCVCSVLIILGSDVGHLSLFVEQSVSQWRRAQQINGGKHQLCVQSASPKSRISSCFLLARFGL